MRQIITLLSVLLLSALFLLCFAIGVLFTGCVEKNKITEHRTAPKYSGIDKNALPLYKEFIDLASTNNVNFTEKITVGFTKINAGKIIGITWYGENFTEIDLDKKVWDNSSEISKKSLFFHELGHALCRRNHNYGINKNYPEASSFGEFVDNFLGEWPFNILPPGRYPDGCPISIMFPHILTDKCMETHEEEYVDEMFDKDLCDPF